MSGTDLVVLAGDIGGTKTKLGLFRLRNAGLERLREQLFPSDPEQRPELLIEQFLGSDRDAVSATCLGVAGPVVDGAVHATNLPWVLQETEVARAVGTPACRLINDLEANARGLPALAASDFHVLQEGRPGSGAAAMLSAGTGLGQVAFLRRAALLSPGQPAPPSSSHTLQVLPSEGGHADLAPVDRDDVPLLQVLWDRYGHASIERVLSGRGIYEMYDILREVDGTPASNPLVADTVARAADRSAEVTKAALAGSCPLCQYVLGKFVRFYGAEAGNLALRMMASGGLYLGGGIAPKILPALTSGEFLRAFLDKGRLRSFLETVPVIIVLNPDTALLGAALYALDLAHPAR